MTRPLSRQRVRLSPAVRMLGGIVLFWMGLYLYIPILTPLVTHITGSAGFAGLVVASYGVPQFCCRALLATWSDRLGQRRPFILGGLGLVLISSLGMALLPSGAGFLVFRTVAGLAASTWAMFSMQYVHQLPADQVPRAMGWASFGNSGGQVLAVVIGGFLAARYGGAAPFWASAAVAIAGILLAAPVPDPSGPAHAAGARVAWGQILTHRDVVVASFLGIVLQAGTFATTFGYVPLWASQHGLASGAVGLLTAVSLVPAALTPILAGAWAARRWRLEAILAVGFLTIGLFTGITPWAGASVGLFVAQALAGIGRGLVAPILMTLAVRGIAPIQRTTALATYQALYAVGIVAGPAAAAALVAQVGLAEVFFLTGWLSALGAVTSLILAFYAMRRAAAASETTAR